MESEVVWGEVILMGAAMLLHGIFEGTETALLAAQKSRLLQWKDEGRHGAATALWLREAPEQALMTLQLGIICTAIFAATLAGAVIVQQVAPWLVAQWPFPSLQVWATTLSLALAIVVLTYTGVIFGQMVPRAIAQQYPEQVVCWMALPLTALVRLSSLVRAILAMSGMVVLRLFGQQRPPKFTPLILITEEEVTTLVREGAERGIFEKVEHELIAGVFEFTDTAAREIMVPRVRIRALDATTPPPEVIHELIDIGHARVPVYEDDLDHIVGILYFKDVMRAFGDGQPVDVRSLLHPPLYVPETVQISRLLRTLQQRHLNMAIVIDEHGGVAGLVTIEDLVEQLVGDIRDEDEPEVDQIVTPLPDGSLAIQGSAPLWELRERYALPVEESSDYQTLAGLLLARLGHIPQGGEAIVEQQYTFTVVDMDGPRIARVKVERRAPEDSGELAPEQAPGPTTAEQNTV